MTAAGVHRDGPYWYFRCALCDLVSARIYTLAEAEDFYLAHYHAEHARAAL